MCHVHDLEGLSLMWETLVRAGRSLSILLEIMISINCALRCEHYLLGEILFNFYFLSCRGRCFIVSYFVFFSFFLLKFRK